MITITGAAGKTGRAAIGALVAKGADVRGLVHREERLQSMRAMGCAEARSGDLTDSGSLRRAFAGSTAIYHICPNMRSDEVEIGERVIRACQVAGVGRLVYHSVLHPQIEAMPHHWNKLLVEERLIESGLEFTILQPAAYMQNVKQQWGRVVEAGVYEVPYASSTSIALVDLREVAEVAARVLTEDGHGAAIYELCGPDAPTQTEIAATLARVVGRSVRLEEIDRTEWQRRAVGGGLGAYATASLMAMFEHYERFGFKGSKRVLEHLLGRPPAPLEDVVRRWLQRLRTNE